MIVQYGIEWVEPEPTEDAIAYAIFLMAKPQLDSNNKKYLTWRGQWHHWKKGWRPRKNPTGDKDKNPIGDMKLKPQTPKHKTPNVNVNVNVSKKESIKKKVTPTHTEPEAKQIMLDLYPDMSWEDWNKDMTKRRSVKFMIMEGYIPPTIDWIDEYCAKMIEKCENLWITPPWSGKADRDKVLAATMKMIEWLKSKGKRSKNWSSQMNTFLS